MTGSNIDIDYAINKFNASLKTGLGTKVIKLHCYTWATPYPDKIQAPITRVSNSNRIIPVMYENQDIFIYHTSTGQSEIEEEEQYGDNKKITESTPMRMTVLSTYSPDKIQKIISNAFPNEIEGNFTVKYTGMDISNPQGIIQRDFPGNTRMDAIHDSVFAIDVNYEFVSTYMSNCANC